MSISGALINGILVFGAASQYVTAILIWMILAILQCIACAIFAVISIINLIKITDVNDTEKIILKLHLIIHIVVYILSIPLTIGAILIAFSARKEILESIDSEVKMNKSEDSSNFELEGVNSDEPTYTYNSKLVTSKLDAWP